MLDLTPPGFLEISTQEMIGRSTTDKRHEELMAKLDRLIEAVEQSQTKRTVPQQEDRKVRYKKAAAIIREWTVYDNESDALALQCAVELLEETAK